MRYTFLILFLFNSGAFVIAQTISNQIRDSKSMAPVQYVNIGIVNKNIGTVSDSLGKFWLPLTNVIDSDSLRISMIGYTSKKYKIGEIKTTEFPKTIFMEEKATVLQEVVVSNVKGKPIQLGLKKKHCYPLPIFKIAKTKVAFPQKSIHHEIGTKFTNSNRIHLDSIQLNIAECNVEYLNLRLNIYSVTKDSIFENLLNEPIYISLTKSEAKNSPVINVTKQDIKIYHDFFVSVENYAHLKNKDIYFFANFKKHGKPFPTFYRRSSQSDWQKLMTKKAKTIGLSFLVFGHS